MQRGGLEGAGAGSLGQQFSRTRHFCARSRTLSSDRFFPFVVSAGVVFGSRVDTAPPVCPPSALCPFMDAPRTIFFTTAPRTLSLTHLNITAEHLEELTGLVTEHMVRMCQHVGDEEVERAKTQVHLLLWAEKSGAVTGDG